ncbi:hypothetical protein [Planctobacterium marinum]|uniref:hypothetical protein n=1 Tax=Planctobacterium marinum TaxID=1631968 RepID=UPI001E56C43B|nr:hypothetical protein [Planctobacterium marinum]MCC2606586.1 hypothetical protein [Planctobacterium marinum]
MSQKELDNNADHQHNRLNQGGPFKTITLFLLGRLDSRTKKIRALNVAGFWVGIIGLAFAVFTHFDGQKTAEESSHDNTVIKEGQIANDVNAQARSDETKIRDLQHHEEVLASDRLSREKTEEYGKSTQNSLNELLEDVDNIASKLASRTLESEPEIPALSLAMDAIKRRDYPTALIRLEEARSNITMDQTKHYYRAMGLASSGNLDSHAAVKYFTAAAETPEGDLVSEILALAIGFQVAPFSRLSEMWLNDAKRILNELLSHIKENPEDEKELHQLSVVFSAKILAQLTEPEEAIRYIEVIQRNTAIFANRHVAGIEGTRAMLAYQKVRLENIINQRGKPSEAQWNELHEEHSSFYARMQLDEIERMWLDIKKDLQRYAELTERNIRYCESQANSNLVVPSVSFSTLISEIVLFDSSLSDSCRRALPDLYYSKVRVHWEREEWEKAEGLLQKIISMAVQPDHQERKAWSHFYLYKIYGLRGDFEQAREQLALMKDVYTNKVTHLLALNRMAIEHLIASFDLWRLEQSEDTPEDLLIKVANFIDDKFFQAFFKEKRSVMYLMAYYLTKSVASNPENGLLIDTNQLEALLKEAEAGLIYTEDEVKENLTFQTKTAMQDLAFFREVLSGRRTVNSDS